MDIKDYQQQNEKPNWFSKIPLFNKLSPKLKIVLRILVYILIVIGVILFLRSPIFNISKTEILPFTDSQLKYIQTSVIDEKINHIYGQNYFKINEKEIAEKVKEEYLVEAVIVEKNLPDGITIKLKERTPFLTINLNETQCINIDKSSFAFDIATTTEDCLAKSDFYDTYYVTLVNSKNTYSLGETSNSFITDSLDKIIFAIEESKYNVSKITIKDEYLEVLLTNGSIIIFNLNHDVDIEIARLYIIIEEIQTDYKEFKTLDLRYERPIIKFP